MATDVLQFFSTERRGKMSYRVWLVPLLLLLGCPQKPPDTNTSLPSTTATKVSDDAFQGLWEYHFSGGIGGFSRWSFDKGQYTLTGYPALEGSGKYHVVRQEG